MFCRWKVLGVKSGVSFLQQVAALVCTRVDPDPNMQGTFLMNVAIAKDVTEEMPEGPFDIILSRYAVAKLNKLPKNIGNYMKLPSQKYL